MSVPPRTGVALVARTSDVLDGPQVDLTLLETRRADSFRSPRDRRDYVAAHLLVRRAAARVLPAGAPPVRVLQHCAVCGEAGHGRPTADGHPDLHLSLSHARGAVAAAAAWSPVGVDIEPRVLRAGATEALCAGTMTAAEQAGLRASDDPPTDFLRLWVRKEALVKVGAAALDRLTDVDLSALSLRDAPGPGGPQRWGRWTLVGWSDADHVAAVAAAGPVPLEAWRPGR